MTISAYVRLFVRTPIPPHLERSEILGEQNAWKLCLMSHYRIKRHTEANKLD